MQPCRLLSHAHSSLYSPAQQFASSDGQSSELCRFRDKGNSIIVTEKETTQDGLFELALQKLSPSAFTYVVHAGVRNIDTFLALDARIPVDLSPCVIDELVSTQQWVRQQIECRYDSITEETTLRADVFDDAEIFHVILNSLSTRCQHTLAYGNVTSCAEFMALDSDTVICWPNTGSKTVAEIVRAQGRLRDLAYKSGGSVRSIDADEVRNVLDKLDQLPHKCIEEPVALRRVQVHNLVKHRAPEPAQWSILRKTITDLSLYDYSANCLEPVVGNDFICTVVDVPDMDWMRLSAGGVYRDDQVDAVMHLTFGYLAALGIGAESLDTLIDSVVRWISIKCTITAVPVSELVTDNPIVNEAEVTPIRNFRIDSFDVPKESLQYLSTRNLVTWNDLVGLTERTILETSDTYLDALLMIDALWTIGLFAREAVATTAGLSPNSFGCFESMVQGFIDLAARTTRERTVLQGRLGLLDGRKWTLEELGNYIGLTRERVRQLEQRRFKILRAPKTTARLAKFWLAVDEALLASGGVCTILEMAERLADKLDWSTKPHDAALVALLQFSDHIIVDKPSEMIINTLHRCSSCETAAATLAALFAEDRSERPLHNVIDELLSACDRNHECAQFLPNLTLSECFVRFIAQKIGGILVKDSVVYCHDTWGSRRGSRAQLVESILRSTKRPMHFTEVYEEAKKLLPEDTKIGEQDVYHWIGNASDLLLWDRGTYIHRDFLQIPTDLIDEISAWVLDRLRSGIPFVSVAGCFSEFADRLVDAGITSESALYTCLRETNDPRLLCLRYPYVRLNDPDAERLPVTIALEQFIQESGGLISYQDTKAYAVQDLCIAEQMAAVHIYNVPNVVRAGKGQFIHVQNLKLNHTRLASVVDYAATRALSEGHVSVDKIYAEKQISCKMMDIDSPEMLYALLQMQPDAGIELSGYPQIVSSGYQSAGGSTSILNEVASYIASKKSPCSFDELEQHFTDDLGYNIGTVYNVVTRDCIVRYSRGSLVHLDALEWTAANQQQIEANAHIIMERAQRAGRSYGLTSQLLDYGHLPRLGNNLVWTQTLVAEILTRDSKFRILGSARNAFVPIPNSAGLETFEDLVYELLRTDYSGACELESFEKDMRDAGIVQKRITPSMLGNQKKVLISGHIILLKELHSNAQ